MCRSNHTEWDSIANTERAAKKGNNSARVQLACAYRHGTNGLERNDQKFLELIQLAADDGSVEGLFNLSAYYRGNKSHRGNNLDSAPVDFDKGIELLRQAAELGCEMSIGELGLCLFGVAEGFDGPETIEAMEYLTLFMASQNGHFAALLCLGKEWGADLNIADIKGCTPLYIAYTLI